MGENFVRRVGMSFLRAFVVTFVLGLTDVISAVGPNATEWGAGKAALVALVVASVTAGVRAIQALTTTIETPR